MVISTRPVKAEILALLLPQSKFVFRMQGVDNRLYLTFDDGPDPQFTPRVLDLLGELEAPATFFCIGRNLERHPELAARAHREGHTLGNHSFCHQRFGSLPRASQLQEVEQTDRLLQEITGKRGHLFRAPQGNWNAGLLLQLMSRGIRCVHWSFDSLDYKKEPTAEFIQRMKVANPVAGDVMLFHDDGALCADALWELVPWWRAAGMTFAALPR
ncbi:polysaccharide deacetylase family protein [Haliea sp. E1-2-M8]|uniref:polysaccharide deacetylase family protein n=1 Tax=Haliea sp. E1-2-M8 TaxID=3064706 RepID=UPI002723F15D|nr:polysaccharide deacetylase family protein [Haliea sp. E1-2-M8]MDO8860424.1 polysaccharide deacetylase family protein [Haliea sp. E1-2-M8]